MAGSWRHMTTKKGKLRDSISMSQMLENGGDVYEALEECYGMVWWLASQLAVNRPESSPEELIQLANDFYKEGLSWSPGVKERDR
jgi:hypothetical protein